MVFEDDLRRWSSKISPAILCCFGPHRMIFWTVHICVYESRFFEDIAGDIVGDIVGDTGLFFTHTA
jgi:hypothetical protein